MNPSNTAGPGRVRGGQRSRGQMKANLAILHVCSFATGAQTFWCSSNKFIPIDFVKNPCNERPYFSSVNLRCRTHRIRTNKIRTGSLKVLAQFNLPSADQNGREDDHELSWSLLDRLDKRTCQSQLYTAQGTDDLEKLEVSLQLLLQLVHRLYSLLPRLKPIGFIIYVLGFSSPSKRTSAPTSV